MFHENGFTLLEVLIAIFLITLGMGAVFVVIQQTVFFTSTSFNKLIASQLAQGGIELVRNIRDSNWLLQRSAPERDWTEDIVCCPVLPCQCQADYNDTALSLYSGEELKFGQGFYNYDSGQDTIFKRKIIISQSPKNPEILQVSVEVSWRERGRDHQITAQENLYDWR